jgi:aspartate carbamoyltransferase regulatory subunit
MTEDKKLLVAAIKDGTVIDRIDAGHALKIIRLLNLAGYKEIVTVGLNLPSKAIGQKDLIKIEKLELSPEQINSIAILAPKATINIIKDYEVVKKFNTKIPEVVKYLITCPNPKCITNHDSTETKFEITNENGLIYMKCYYCEKEFKESEITEYKHN